MLYVFIFLLINYIAFIIYKVSKTNRIRRKLKVGDLCKVYIGESKFWGSVQRIYNSTVDVWVLNRTISVSRNEVYA
jgi:hypothetical protein